MAATGFTPIFIYSSSTGGNVPAAANLTNTTLGSELAINITDGYLYYKDNANAVQKIGYKLVPTANGGTGLTSFTANGIVYASSTSALATSSNFVYSASDNYLGLGFSSATAWAANTSTTNVQVNNSSATNNSTALYLAQTVYGDSSTGGVKFGAVASASYSADFVVANRNVGTYQENLRVKYSGDVTVNTGNLVIGTSGKGIDFSATAGTGTSELLADYEEGTWTPTPSGITVNSGTPVYSGTYTKIGRSVTVNWYMSGGNITTVAGTSKFTNLPYANSQYCVGVFENELTFAFGPMETTSGTNLQLNAAITGSYMAGSVTYIV